MDQGGPEDPRNHQALGVAGKCPLTRLPPRKGEGAASGKGKGGGPRAVGLTPTEEEGLALNQALRRTQGTPEGADTPRKGEAQDPGEEEVYGQEAYPGARGWHTFAFEAAKSVLNVFDKNEGRAPAMGYKSTTVGKAAKVRT